MTKRIATVLALVAASVPAWCGGERRLMSDVLQHLELARRCAASGQAESAIAHANVVMPDHCLRVRVDCPEAAPSRQSNFRNALAGAFRMWDDALGEHLFEITETEKPDVVVHFRSCVSDHGVDVCGHSCWTRGVLDPMGAPAVVFTADVQVRTARPDGRPLTMEQLRACVAHELGHVLGLDDSTEPGDLMGRMDFSHPVSWIRPEEVQSLIRARAESTRIRRLFLSRVSKD